MMTTLFGREYSRRELLDRVGDMSQLAGTRKAELVEIREVNYFHEQRPLFPVFYITIIGSNTATGIIVDIDHASIGKWRG